MRLFAHEPTNKLKLKLSIFYWLDFLLRRSVRLFCTWVLKKIQAVKNLVGLGGFEPPTSPLSGVRSNQLSYRPLGNSRFLQYIFGGAMRDRTADLLRARQALSQLSYSPKFLWFIPLLTLSLVIQSVICYSCKLPLSILRENLIKEITLRNLFLLIFLIEINILYIVLLLYR